MRILWPLLLLAACAGPRPPPVCEVKQVADIPLGAERGFLSADATIDDKPVTLLVDTGAEATMVTPAALARLHLGADPHRRTTLHGVGGAVVSQNALLQSFGLGGLVLLDQSAAVAPLPVTQGVALHASGLLGADWLSAFDVEIDLPQRRMRLYQVHDCSGDYVPWSGARVSSAVQLYGRGLVLLPATLDGSEVRALLDTGANRSALGEAAADQIGLTATALTRDPVSQSVGVDGAISATREHRFDTLRVAGLRTSGLVVSISPLRLGIADLLLGADWLAHVRVWISYANRRVTVQPG